MADRRETVTREVNNGVTESGTSVQQETTETHTTANADNKTTAVNAIWYIYGVIAVLLSIRFVLRLLGANSANAFVDFIYAVSGVLSAPFDSIFGVTTAEAGRTESVFEPSILVAIAVYALIAWAVVKLLRINETK